MQVQIEKQEDLLKQYLKFCVNVTFISAATTSNADWLLEKQKIITPSVDIIDLNSDCKFILKAALIITD